MYHLAGAAGAASAGAEASSSGAPTVEVTLGAFPPTFWTELGTAALISFP